MLIGERHEPRTQQVQGLRWCDITHIPYRSHLADQITDGNNPREHPGAGIVYEIQAPGDALQLRQRSVTPLAREFCWCPCVHPIDRLELAAGEVIAAVTSRCPETVIPSIFVVLAACGEPAVVPSDR